MVRVFFVETYLTNPYKKVTIIIVNRKVCNCKNFKVFNCGCLSHE